MAAGNGPGPSGMEASSFRLSPPGCEYSTLGIRTPCAAATARHRPTRSTKRISNYDSSECSDRGQSKCPSHFGCVLFDLAQVRFAILYFAILLQPVERLVL